MEEKLFDLWAKRNPQWEIRYKDTIISVFSDYKVGANNMNESKGKIFGGGYETFIIAFFIGLYYNQQRPLTENSKDRTTFGQPIQYWGNLSSTKSRISYPKIREYMFIALVARTDIDLIALEKGEIKASAVIDKLIDTMEKYANWGYHFIYDKLSDDPNYFFKDTAFFEVFFSHAKSQLAKDNDKDDELESLD